MEETDAEDPRGKVEMTCKFCEIFGQHLKEPTGPTNGGAGRGAGRGDAMEGDTGGAVSTDATDARGLQAVGAREQGAECESRVAVGVLVMDTVMRRE